MSVAAPAATPTRTATTPAADPDEKRTDEELIQLTTDHIELLKSMVDQAKLFVRNPETPLQELLSHYEILGTTPMLFFSGRRFQVVTTQTQDPSLAANLKGMKDEHSKVYAQAEEKLKMLIKEAQKPLQEVVAVGPNNLDKLLDVLPKLQDDGKKDKDRVGANFYVISQFQHMRNILNPLISSASASTFVDMALLRRFDEVVTAFDVRNTTMSAIAGKLELKEVASVTVNLTRAQLAGYAGSDIDEYKRQFEKIQNKLAKEGDKDGKRMRKVDVLTEKLPFTNLVTVYANSYLITSLGSILPLPTNWKKLIEEKPESQYRYGQKGPVTEAELYAIDLSVPGVLTTPHLRHYLDTYVKVPVIVYDCLQYIRYCFGWTEEGIFRLSGNNDNIANCLSIYSMIHDESAREGHFSSSNFGYITPCYKGPFTEPHPSFAMSSLKSPHDATNVMKRWLRALSDPVIPFTQFNDWSQANQLPHLSTAYNVAVVPDQATMEEHYKESQRLQKFHQLIHALPPNNLHLLTYLCLFLYVVSLNHAVSKMTPENLAIVIAPNLLRTVEDSQQQSNNSSLSQLLTPAMFSNKDIVQNSKVVNEVFTLVIKYAPILFVAPTTQDA